MNGTVKIFFSARDMVLTIEYSEVVSHTRPHFEQSISTYLFKFHFRSLSPMYRQTVQLKSEKSHSVECSVVNFLCEDY